MRGIILAGGKGSRLWPATKGIPKSLIPVYDKPMIFYPLSTLMLSGIKDVLVITTPEFVNNFKSALGNGDEMGIHISYKTQKEPRGIADAFIVGEEFIGKDNSCLILGDNLFYGHGLTDMLLSASQKKEGATVFGYEVKNPEIYGVVGFDENRRVTSIEEKPKNPKSNFAVVGLYFYDNDVIEIAKNLRPSARGEIEITDVNQEYLRRGNLEVQLMGRGFAWLDTGSFESLNQASDYVKAIQDRQGLKVDCPYEIAYKHGWISRETLAKTIEELKSSGYGEDLSRLLKN
ncbi:MAG: glucose-1-phosphate thymidylyltransferase RfbA [archaeon]|nr:glucose-1-phosphate thymidylyltransferase RfbA [archaeon]